MQYVRPFREIRLSGIPSVGGKNASLGELIANLSPLGVKVPDGFALTAEAQLIDAAHARKRKVGICGQAPSDYPDFAAFLVKHHVDSISLSPDALVRTMKRVMNVENELSSTEKVVP